MGREWLYKGSGGGGDGCGGSRGGEKSPSVITAKTVNKSKKRKEKNMDSSSSGCMSAIFGLFDIQHHQSFRFHHPSFISESTINLNSQQSNFGGLQGVEAPRNSLETPESAMDYNIAPSSSKVNEQKNLNIQMDGIKIKTQRSRFTDDVSSECSTSPSTKTPGLVARLMGLDLLPEYSSSPRPSSSSTPPVNSHHRSRSLPTTPRISTASRRSADNDYHHRLSLQVDKENDMKIMTRRKSEEYAKQIANQVRERINRRLGTDITNTVSMTKNKEQRRDSNLVMLKPKKVVARTPVTPMGSVATTKVKNDENTTFTSSPKLRLLDVNNNLNKPMSHSQSSQPSIKVEKPLIEKKIKRIASERYDLRLKKMSQQDDAIVRKVCKKKATMLQHHVVNFKNTTKFLSFKKEMTSSSSTTRRLPQKQVSFLVSMKDLPSNQNSPYNNNVVTTTTTFSDHFNYISRIMDQCGIYHTTLISYGQWHTPSHPLHPSIFHTLEKQYHHTNNTTKRKMIFDLVDELLSGILKPYMNWVGPNLARDLCTMCGNELITKLCDKIASFGPGAKCDTLEDIDGLIERDIGRSLRRFLTTEVEAEMEEVVTEIVEMIVVEMVEPARTDKMRSHVMFT